VFGRLRDAINAALDAATPGEDPRGLERSMHEAVVEARASLDAMRDGIEATKRQLLREQRQREDAERRGRLAGEINDQETVEIANRFAAKHGERVEMLELKLKAQQEELELAERELSEMREKLKEVRATRPQREVASGIEAAWRALEQAGATRPDTDVEDQALRYRMDQASKEAAAEEQLQRLKKKMGR
jgi:hypothetical protein